MLMWQEVKPKAEAGRAVRALRRGRDVTQAQLAKVLGCAESTICRWESGKRALPLDALAEIAKAFKVPVTYFLEEATPERPEWGKK